MTEEMTQTTVEPDVLVENHGSIILFRAKTSAAKSWIDEHVQTEGWQWFGEAFAVEPRYAEFLAMGMTGDGLVVR